MYCLAERLGKPGGASAMKQLSCASSLPSSFLEAYKVVSLQDKEWSLSLPSKEKTSTLSKQNGVKYEGLEGIEIRFVDSPLQENSSPSLLFLSEPKSSVIYEKNRILWKEDPHSSIQEIASKKQWQDVLRGDADIYRIDPSLSLSELLTELNFVLGMLDRLEEKKKEQSGAKDYFLRLFVKTSLSRKHYKLENYFFPLLFACQENTVLYVKKDGDYRYYQKVLGFLEHLEINKQED